jgi:hypothetical protein
LSEDYFEAKSRRSFSSAELLDLLESAQKTLGKFKPLPKKNMNSAEFESRSSLQHFILPTGVRVKSVELVTATFQPGSDPVQEMQRIALAGHAAFGESFNVDCIIRPLRFQEAKRPDQTGVMFWQGKLFVTYDCRAESRVLDEDPKDYFKEIIERSGLPIRLSEDDRGYYLHHTQNGLLRSLSADIFQSNPSSFWCEVTEMAKAIPVVRAIIGDSPVTAMEWTLIPREEETLNWGELLAPGLPSQKFSINFTYDLENLEALEALTSAKMSSGFFATDVATFKLNGKSGKLDVRSNPKGHTLFAEIPKKLLPELNQKLGVTMLPYDE